MVDTVCSDAVFTAKSLENSNARAKLLGNMLIQFVSNGFPGSFDHQHKIM